MDSGVNTVPASFSFTENFIKAFPIYLSYGISPYDYWHGDPSLAYAYREAHREKLKEQNILAWLQGRYIYDALCEVSPVYNPFAKKGTKPIPYTKEPYPIDEDDNEEKQAVKRLTGYNRIKMFAERYKEKKDNG